MGIFKKKDKDTNIFGKPKKTTNIFGKPKGGGKKQLGFKVLLPFKKLMITALKTKHIPVSPSDKIDRVAVLFNDHVINKKSAYDAKDTEFLNEEGSEHIYAEAAQQIIKIILEFIKKLKEKKDSGKQLTQDENQIVEEAQKVADTVDTEPSQKEGGNWIKDNWILLAIGSVVVYFLFIKKKS